MLSADTISNWAGMLSGPVALWAFKFLKAPEHPAVQPQFVTYLGVEMFLGQVLMWGLLAKTQRKTVCLGGRLWTLDQRVLLKYNWMQ